MIKQEHRLAGADRSSIFLLKGEGTYLNTSIKKEEDRRGRGVYSVGVWSFITLSFKKAKKKAKKNGLSKIKQGTKLSQNHVFNIKKG